MFNMNQVKEEIIQSIYYNEGIRTFSILTKTNNLETRDNFPPTNNFLFVKRPKGFHKIEISITAETNGNPIFNN